METTEEYAIGKLRLDGNDIENSMDCDRLCYSYGTENNLMIASVIAPATTLKAFRAVLTSSTKVKIKPDGLSMGSYAEIKRSKHGYNIWTHRLGYGNFQMVAIAKHPGLLINNTAASFWKFLKSENVTTPVIKEWIPYLSKKLNDSYYTRSLRQHNTNAVLLDCNTETIDEFVEKGIASGELTFPPKGSAK